MSSIQFWAGLCFFWFVVFVSNQIIISNLKEEFFPGLNLYESKEECIYAEKKDCSLKYIEAYIPKGDQ